ncbi:MAG: ThuA domain-containing protein [Verrucomicrobiales bacterium]|nr:ThuA domain-containing protein [Verrucomicrobiales bacterium]
MQRWILVLFLCAGLARVQSAETTEQPVKVLVPGFTVRELPVRLSNINNLRFAPDGSLTALGYDGRVWLLKDSNGDGLEDSAAPFWDKPTLSVPLGMAWSAHGLFVSSKGKVSLLKDTDRDGVADVEEVIASGWPLTDVGTGGVDATAATLDADGNLYFGLMVADYSNAYRLRKRKDLKLEEVAWLKQQGRWREPSAVDSADEQFSLYDLNSRRGTIQKWDPRAKQLTTIATGIRVPVALAFNRAGDLFNTDQEGETWMPNGNPFDELNHIIAGRNYGFPPRHETWLPDLQSEKPVVEFGPQHQSACGLVFNEPHAPMNPASTKEDAVSRPAAPARGLFGPKSWEGNALVAGQSRGKIFRVSLVKTPGGYVGTAQTIARLSMLTVDLAISPRGELYVACHSGPPDWGTGPRGEGRIFQITYQDSPTPLPVAASPSGPAELRVAFDKPLHADVIRSAIGSNATIEFGEYVSAGDRFESLRPPYAVVSQQDATPRGRLSIHAARLEDGGRTLVLSTDPHPLAVRYAVTLPGIKGAGETGAGATIDLDYDLTQSSQPLPPGVARVSPETWKQPVPWAPKARASAGTDSRAPRKPDGDWETGRTLFSSEQLQCAKCHRIRSEGGTAGPDLSNLIHRDAASILRDIREPNATLHPDYVTYQVAMKDGDVIQGFVRSQKEDSIQLFDVDGKETVLARANIESVRPTEISLMPSGLLDSLNETEARDLLTYMLWEPPRRSPEVLVRLASQDQSQPEEPKRELRLVLVASRQDHGHGQHDYPNWQTNWLRLLSSPASKTVAEAAWEWPTPAQFDAASVVVFYFWNHHWSPARLAQLDAYLERGGGVALVHSAVIADKEPEHLGRRIGLSAQPGRTGYRHMPFELKLVDREHPVTRGLPERIDLLDEPYWPLIGDVSDVHILASADVDGETRPLIWIRQQGKGRIFASIPGHYTWTLDDPLFRQLLLRGISWAAGEHVARLNDKPARSRATRP